MVSRRCCCGCLCECSVCAGSDYTAVCCFTLKLKHVNPPSGGAVCSYCAAEDSEICISYAKDSQLDCTWNARISYLACGGETSPEDFVLTLTEDSGPGSNVTLTVTTSHGGSFELSLGANPDCCTGGEQQLTVNSWPSWNCDFSEAEAWISFDNKCYACGGGVGYHHFFRFSGFAQPEGPCGCPANCTDMNNYIVEMIGTSVQYDPINGDHNFLRAVPFVVASESGDPTGTYPLRKDPNSKTICGMERAYYYVTNPSAYPYTGEVTLKLEVWVASGTWGNNNYTQCEADWLYFMGTTTVPADFNSGDINRTSEWLRLHEVWCPFVEWQPCRRYRTEYENLGHEYFCDVENAGVIWWADWKGLSRLGVTEDFPYSICGSTRESNPYNPAWCHGNKVWEERTITLQENLSYYTGLGPCKISAGDYILESTTVCFGISQLIPLPEPHCIVNYYTQYIEQTHVQFTLTLLPYPTTTLNWDPRSGPYVYDLRIKVYPGAYNIIGEWWYRSEPFYLPLCDAAVVNEDVSCEELEGTTVELNCYKRLVYSPYSGGFYWTDCLTGYDAPLPVILEHTLLGDKP